ncbi:MAG: hypothetical protein Q8T08_06540 [Ignavibacteria bacterium]|nr:hypothetical protein [Ignavibacteria bacterium]
MNTITVSKLSGIRYRVNRKNVIAYGNIINCDQSLTTEETTALQLFMQKWPSIRVQSSIVSL